MSNAKKVNIAEFKAHMGAYLKRVRNGEDVILKDRDVEIAKISALQDDASGITILKALRPIKDYDAYVAPQVNLSQINSLELLKEMRDDKR